MALLSFIFFAGVLALSGWAIFATIVPRLDYIVTLLTDAAVAPVGVPVAQRRLVRRLNPSRLRAELQTMRAAA